MAKEPSFHPHEPISAGLSRIVGKLVDGALAPIARPSGALDEDIHEIRTSLKRLRALLLLIRPSVAQRSYERENARLREAARRLAVTRDLAVARKTLRAFAKTATGERDRQAFTQVLKGFHRSAVPTDPTDHRKAFREVAAALRQSGKSIPRLRVRGWEWEAVGPGLEAVYRAGRKRMKQAFAKGEDAGFHRWRIRVKNLCYQLEMLAPAWPERLCQVLACLRKLQNRLGDDHDLAVVKSALEEAPDAFGGACAVQRVILCLDRRSQKLRKASRKLGDAIFDQKPRRFIDELEKHWSAWRETDRPAPSQIAPDEVTKRPAHGTALRRPAPPVAPRRRGSSVRSFARR